MACVLIHQNNLSTHKSHNVLEAVSKRSFSLPIPSQSGIWRRIISEGKEMKAKIIEKLRNGDQYCLHFDGKRLGGEEYQVVLLKNSEAEIKLSILKCENGSAKDIHRELHSLINDYDAWRNIRMIICDTTAVNTGHLNGIVKLIQDDFITKGFQKPQYIGCQHHVLDLLLKHVMNFLIPGSTTKPELTYSFIENISKNYKFLQDEYNKTAKDDIKADDNPGWRDDFKFLYELCQAYRHYKSTSRWPRINWKKLPNLHLARWNSRAIYAAAAFFLLPDWRCILGTACNFICYEWSDAWFQTQHYSESIFNNLLNSLGNTKCEKAIKCLKTHWNQEKSLSDIPRSNQNAERAVKLMEELHENSKKHSYLNLKFIGRNNL